LSIFTNLKRLIKVETEVNMPGAKQITRPTPYASSDDFHRVFDQDMNSLHLLSFLLTANRGKSN